MVATLSDAQSWNQAAQESAALGPFELPVRTLDGLHLATMHYLGATGAPVGLASYDSRLLASAKSMGFETVSP